ncbi:[acyl-carrier-protein] S-malonyltransferase [Leifsonia sp. 98AMF]|uniref:ACP S-malonyltransferase n=1 Tax=unclassified Leifsonia TaxID=2663824 RepID=UPI000879A74A|nr:MULTISPECIES: ACP S-malonyltransferase [unclassified Leifsonia]SDH33377.1 [acyl-carrier-protein] S-malonyltransferase [Leifsonia sp. 197AMF]SDJ01656.1 [acyl-carrier-protein] S-malonyltransferase [Leifsonia sp. 466MF]SDJ71844.1 [acyl-carrier-protein] S-malonyltransferase [Leifsonia sp. 157MF]SDO05356.1 [acyl-carrier-protein] S-malonyltransferase [Leifsonia sp. 509MF]SEM98741.1 [acyl-carrier-protein] S-malonyltransferase [Leifsonia sp. 467MF]
MIVIVCPGQGSQTPGFLDPWLSESSFRDQLTGISDAVGIDLVAHGTVSDADTIRDTAIAQPLIVSAGLLTLSALFADERRDRVGGIAGHSVGELTAAAGAGVLSETDAVAFVRERGAAMARAAAEAQTGMSAVIGADETELLARLDELGLSPANYNGGGQIVVAGALDALAQLAENPPVRARVIPLQVAGAFHTRYMASAVPALEQFASTLTTNDPTLRLWTNKDGSEVTDGAEFLRLLVGQVSSPVRWDLDMKAFEEAGVTGLIEVAPAGALVGLAKRGLKGVPTVAIKTPDDLPAAFDLIDQAA